MLWRSFFSHSDREQWYYDISILSFELKLLPYDQRMLTHAPWVPPVLRPSFLCHGSKVSYGINLKQLKFREIIKRPPYCSCPLPFPHLSLFTGRRGIAFLQTPSPLDTLTHAHIRDWAESLSDPAGVRMGGKSGGGWSTPHSLYPWQHRHQTKPPPTVAVPPKQRHLCALVCINKERGQIQRRFSN